MAGASKRTTVALGTVAVIFIIVIIILCLVPDPCRKNDPKCMKKYGDPNQGRQNASRFTTEGPPTTAFTSPSSTESTSTTVSSTISDKSSTLSSTVADLPPSTSTEPTSSTMITTESTSTTATTTLKGETSSTIISSEASTSETSTATTSSSSSSSSSTDATSSSATTVSSTSTVKDETTSDTTSASTAQTSDTTSGTSTTQASDTRSGTSTTQTSDTTSGISTTQTSDTTSGTSTTQISDTRSGTSTTQTSDTTSGTSTTQISDISSGTSTTQISDTSGTSTTQISDTTSGTSTTQTSDTTSGTTATTQGEIELTSTTMASTTMSEGTTATTTTTVSATTTTETTPTTLASDTTTTTSLETETTTKPPEVTTLSDISRPTKKHDGEVCDTPICREVARRMLDILDPNDIDPCEDFYQYSCGGILDDPFLKPENPKHYVDKLIKDALANGDREDATLKELFTMYDSCLDYGNSSYDHEERVEAAKKVIGSFGLTLNPKAHTTGAKLFPDHPEDFDLTTNLVEMMKRNFAPFFDILIDVNEDDPRSYRLKMVLPIMESPYSKDRAHSVCFANYTEKSIEAKKKGETYDIDSHYIEYYQCKYFGNGLQARLDDITKKVKSLDLTGFIGNTDAEEQVLSAAKFSLNSLLEKIGKVTPSPPEIRKALLNKDYEIVTVKDIDEGKVFGDIPIEIGPFIKELFFKTASLDNVKVQVYFKDVFKQIFEIIYDELDGDKPAFESAMVLLWMERVYDDLVSPVGFTVGSPEYCFSAVTKRMDDYVSYLYLKELEKQDYDYLNEELKKMIILSKDVMKKQLEQSTLTSKDNFSEKAENMKEEVALPFDVGPMTETKISLVEKDFVTNYDNLQRNYRERLYHISKSSRGEGRWSVFQLIYNTSPVTSYALNTFFVPHGAMSPPLFYKDAPGFINYAGIGYVIAHEIMHGFDPTGLKFPGVYGLDDEDEEDGPIKADDKYIDATECLAEQLSKLFTMTSSTGLTVNFTLDNKFSLNELLSDIAATRMAWDTYQRDLSGDLPSTEAPEIIFNSSPARRRRRRRRQASMDSEAVAVSGGEDSRTELLSSGTGLEEFGFQLHQKLVHWEKFTALQLYFIKMAQNQCSATSEIDLLSVKENEHLPPKLRVNMALGNNPLFMKAFGCDKRKTPGKMMPPDGQCPFRPLGDNRY